MSKINAVVSAQLKLQMLTLLQKYIYITRAIIKKHMGLQMSEPDNSDG